MKSNEFEKNINNSNSLKNFYKSNKNQKISTILKQSNKFGF